MLAHHGGGLEFTEFAYESCGAATVAVIVRHRPSVDADDRAMRRDLAVGHTRRESNDIAMVRTAESVREFACRRRSVHVCASDDRESVHGRFGDVAVVQPKPGASPQHLSPAPHGVPPQLVQHRAIFTCYGRIDLLGRGEAKCGRHRAFEVGLGTTKRCIKVGNPRGAKTIPRRISGKRVKQPTEIFRRQERALEYQQSQATHLGVVPPGPFGSGEQVESALNRVAAVFDSAWRAAQMRKQCIPATVLDVGRLDVVDSDRHLHDGIEDHSFARRKRHVLAISVGSQV